MAQLAGGPLLAHKTWLATYRRRMAALVFFSAAGAAGFVPSLLARAGPAAAGGGAAALVALLGLSVGSCTVVWHCASSDPLCRGARGTGLVAGALNTIIIAIDAVAQTAVGAALGAGWNGRKDPHSGDPVYSPQAYAKAFSILLATFAVATACAAGLWWTNGGGVGDADADDDDDEESTDAPPDPPGVYGSFGNGGSAEHSFDGEHPVLMARLKARSDSRDLSNIGAALMEEARIRRSSTNVEDQQEEEDEEQVEQIDYAALIDESDDGV